MKNSYIEMIIVKISTKKACKCHIAFSKYKATNIIYALGVMNFWDKLI